MKKALTMVLSLAILALIGCGGEGTKEVVKDAAYHKEELRKMTTIKALNTDERVLFTMKSLRDNFLQSFDVNGTNEGINRDIIELFKSNIEESIDVLDNFSITDDTPILMPSDKVKEQPEKHIEAKLKSAIKTACADCKDDDVNNWFVNNRTKLEMSIESNSGVDETDDKQKLITSDEPPPIIFVVLMPDRKGIDIHIGSNDDTHDFVEMQTERAEAYRAIDGLFN